MLDNGAESPAVDLLQILGSDSTIRFDERTYREQIIVNENIIHRLNDHSEIIDGNHLIKDLLVVELVEAAINKAGRFLLTAHKPLYCK